MRHAFLGALTALAAGSTILSAQQANASAAAYGMGGNYTAQARGYNAVAWNPANLGQPGNPSFSLTIGAFGATSGLDPVDASAFNDFAGKYIPASTRQAWLSQVTTKGGETGSADGGITWLAANFGSLGLQVSSSGYGVAKMNPDAFEALMFGNAGNGSTRNLNFAGSTFRGGSFTTAAASYGMSFGGDAKKGEAFSLGVTGKYIIGHVMAMAQDAGSATTASNINVNFPVIHTNFDDAGNAGNGMGADIGAAWTSNGWRMGASVMNVFNSFEWDTSKLRTRKGTGTFDGNTFDTNFDTSAFSTAPASLQQKVTDNKFKPSINVGLAHDYSSSLTLTADAHQQMTDDNSIVSGPKTQVGVGAEFRGIPMLPLRGGVSYVTGGMAYSGGVGIKLGAYELAASVAIRNSDEGKATGLMLSVFSLR